MKGFIKIFLKAQIPFETWLSEAVHFFVDFSLNTKTVKSSKTIG